jgi:NAD-dependent SIR2 family protein deacetylase
MRPILRWGFVAGKPRRCGRVLHVDAQRLREFIDRHARLFVLTGAGCSTDSGIPDYRDAEGAWKRSPPVQYPAFVADPAVRQRYWARSLVGWPHFGFARPNATHRVLAGLEADGHIDLLVTQNVDGLHQQAGSRRVIDLHGRLDTVTCLACAARTRRADLQARLAACNPGWVDRQARVGPDGDVDLEAPDFASFAVPDCEDCGGLLKPDVVFFGEPVPRERVEAAFEGVARADALLVVGSSLMVYSGYRFVRAAAEAGKPVAALNLGRTRADDLLSLKLDARCGETLAALEALQPGP